MSTPEGLARTLGPVFGRVKHVFGVSHDWAEALTHRCHPDQNRTSAESTSGQPATPPTTRVRASSSRHHSSRTALTRPDSESLASPKSIVVFWSYSSGLSTPANPGRMLRLRNTTA